MIAISIFNASGLQCADFPCNSLTFTQCNGRPNILCGQFHLHVQVIFVLKVNNEYQSEIRHPLLHLLHHPPPLLRPLRRHCLHHFHH